MLETNRFPHYDMSENTTGCCPKFNTKGWDDQELHLEDRLFVKAETRSFLYFPLNMGSVFTKTMEAIQNADAFDNEQWLVLTHDISPWKSEHYFSVNKQVSGQHMTKLSGNFITKVFEGPYREAKNWMGELKTFVEEKGRNLIMPYFFYTTCPKCAKHYGKNYVIGVAEVD